MLNVHFNIDTQLSRAQQAFAAGDLMQARALIVQVLEQQPEHPRAWHMLGAIFLAAGKPDLAVQYLQRSVASAPTRAAAHCDLALALREAGQIGPAIRHYRLATALQPDVSMPHEQLDELLAAQGMAPGSLPPDPQFLTELNALAAYAATTDFPLAISLYELSLSADPQQPATLAHMGSLYMCNGQEQSAVGVLRRSVDLGNRSAETYHQLAQALRKRQWFHEALEAAQAAAQANPTVPEIQRTISQIQADMHSRDAMVAKLQQELAANPTSEELKFKLALVAEQVDLSTMPVSRVVKLFDEYAGYFEAHLLKRLKYRGHEQLYDAVTSAAPGAAAAGRKFDILDLGCGTGLCGTKFKPLARFLKGVDVSPAMITRAQATGVYDEVATLELLAALQLQTQRYDLILAADVFEYVGDLQPTFAAAANALRPGGLFAFTVEKTEKTAGSGFIYHRQTSSFAHSLEYIRKLAQQNGFAQLYAKESIMRIEVGVPLVAWIIVLQK